MKRCYTLCAGMALALLGSYVVYESAEPAVARAAAPAAKSAAPRAVEDDMHEFMEYVFQPTYKRLKQAMAVEPTDNRVWKVVKSDSLILAEGGNLLLFHGEAQDAEWAETSIAVRELGGKLYQAAKKKDYASASEHYKAMLNKCNSCHTTFAGGEHQLAP